MKNKDYNRGYNLAKIAILDNDTLDLLNQARSSLSNDDFDKGWKKACEEDLKEREYGITR